MMYLTRVPFVWQPKLKIGQLLFTLLHSPSSIIQALIVILGNLVFLMYNLGSTSEIGIGGKPFSHWSVASRQVEAEDMKSDRSLNRGREITYTCQEHNCRTLS